MNCAYRVAYSRINALVIVGEGLADSHFRLLAALLPEDRQELQRLAAMEAAMPATLLAAARSWGSARTCRWRSGCSRPCIACSARRCARGIGSAPW